MKRWAKIALGITAAMAGVMLALVMLSFLANDLRLEGLRRSRLSANTAPASSSDLSANPVFSEDLDAADEDDKRGVDSSPVAEIDQGQVAEEDDDLPVPRSAQSSETDEIREARIAEMAERVARWELNRADQDLRGASRLLSQGLTTTYLGGLKLVESIAHFSGMKLHPEIYVEIGRESVRHGNIEVGQLYIGLADELSPPGTRDERTARSIEDALWELRWVEEELAKDRDEVL